MRQYKYKKVERKVEVYRTCNKCGFKYPVDDQEYPPIYHLEVHFGYENNRHDGEHWHFDLCTECLEELVSSFQIPHQINGEDSLGEVPGDAFDLYT